MLFAYNKNIDEKYMPNNQKTFETKAYLKI